MITSEQLYDVVARLSFGFLTKAQTWGHCTSEEEFIV